MAHIAFANDAALRRILRHFVRAHHHAITAADALVVEMPDNAGRRILVVGEHGTARGAGGFEAMMAGGGDNLLEWFDAIAAARLRHERFAKKRADFAPRFAVIESVEGMACGYARLTAATAIEIHFEGVLLARARRGEGNELAIARGDNFVAFVGACESFDGRELPLLGEQFIDQSAG